MAPSDDPNTWLTGRSRETRIRRDELGRWFNGDDPIDHPNLVHAFDRWIERAEDGRYCLKNSVNWAYVQVEGAPIFVRGLRVEAGRVRLRLSDGRSELLDPASLRQSEEGVLYCSVREGRLTAKLDRSAVQALESLLDEDDQGPFLFLEGMKIRPPVVADPLSNPARRP